MIFGKAVNSRIGHPPVNGNFGENLSIPAFLLQRRTGASLCAVFPTTTPPEEYHFERRLFKRSPEENH
jgi:hypothetical protein